MTTDHGRSLGEDEFLRRAGTEVPGDLLADLLGGPLPDRGVIHVAAVARSDGPRRALRIGAGGPRSVVDAWLLQTVRSWADAVLTTGAILRAEPELRFEPTGPTPEVTARLRAARDRRGPLEVLVLGSGRGLEPGMPVWTGGGRFTLFTDAAGADRVAPWAGDVGLRVVAVERPGPRAMSALAAEHPVDEPPRRVSVELGPSTSAALHAPPSLVDVLLLAEVDTPLPEELLAGPLLPDRDLERDLQPSAILRSGGWTFRRFEARGGRQGA